MTPEPQHLQNICEKGYLEPRGYADSVTIMLCACQVPPGGSRGGFKDPASPGQAPQLSAHPVRPQKGTKGNAGHPKAGIRLHSSATKGGASFKRPIATYNSPGDSGGRCFSRTSGRECDMKRPRRCAGRDFTGGALLTQREG